MGEPERVEVLEADAEDMPVALLGDLFTADIIVYDQAGNVPYVDPINCCAHLYAAEVEANADNSEVLGEPGASHLVIEVYQDHWHVARVSGYVPDTGPYTRRY